MATDFFDTPATAPAKQQSGGNFFDTTTIEAPEKAIAGVPAPAKPAGFFSTIGDALKTVAAKIGGAIEGVAKAPLPTLATIPKNNAPILAQKAQTNFFDAPTPTVPQAITSLAPKSTAAKSPFSSTPAGIATHTILGLPKGILDAIGAGPLIDSIKKNGLSEFGQIRPSDIENGLGSTVSKIVNTPVADVEGIFKGPSTYHQLYGYGDIDNIQKTTADAIANGESPATAVLNAIPQSIFDALPLDALDRGGAKAASGDTASITADEHTAAHEFLGKPATMAEARQNYLDIQKEFHPDKTGGDDTISKAANNAYRILKEKGIPEGSAKGSVDNRPKAPVKEIGDDAAAQPKPEDIQKVAEQVTAGKRALSAVADEKTTNLIDLAKSSESPEDFISKALIPGEEVAKQLKTTGTSGGASDFLLDTVKKEDYTIQPVKIDDLVKNDPDLKEYIDNNNGKIRKYFPKQNASHPIVTSKGEVWDGYNRIAQAIKNGETEIKVFKGTDKQSLDDIYNQAQEEKINSISPEIQKLPITDEQKNAMQAFMDGDTTPKTRAALDAVDAGVLDEVSIKRENGAYERTATDIQQRGGNAENGSGNAGGSILSIPGVDRLDAERRLARGTAKAGDGAEMARAEGRRLLAGKRVRITENTHLVFRALGFGDAFSDMFDDAYRAGGVRNVSFDAQIDIGDGKRAEINAGYAVVDEKGKRVDMLQLNYESRDMEIFRSGDIVRHEVFGHSWYTDLSRAEKVQIIEGLRDDTTPLLDAWKKSVVTHDPYWDMTVTQLAELVMSKGVSREMAMALLKDAGIERKSQTLEEFVDSTLGLQKNLDLVNAHLEELGYPAIVSGAESLIALHEHVALVAEQSRSISSSNPMIQSYIERVADGSLSFKNKATPPSRTLTPSTMAAVREHLDAADGLSTKILEKLKGRSTVSRQFIEDLTNSGDVTQAERNLIRKALADAPSTVNVKELSDRVKAELLPLRVKANEYDIEPGVRAGGKYENVALPESERGSVADYSEHIFESPVKTSAGNVHFSGATENYFGHTRIEDMADRETRRIIEVQSDLYQKGRLEQEGLGYGSPKTQEEIDSTIKRLREMGQSESQIQNLIRPELQNIQKAKDLKKLSQYNNPSAHFRMVREEIKQAALDGKTKLQFPTGETAMKIEGLGQANRWSFFPTPEGKLIDLKPSDLKSGLEINMSDRAQSWIVTDILGDGKFKAVTKYKLVGKNPDNIDLKKFIENTRQSPVDNAALRFNEETFDISGKTDTNNPIYRFYQKDLGRYLKSNYGAKEITDDKGVSWYEVPIDEEDAYRPVLASIKGEKPSNEELQSLLKSSEEKSRENRQSDRLKELDTVVADSSNHEAFMRNLKKNTKLGELLPQIDKDVHDNGYQNLSDYYVKNKITSNVKNGVVPERQYAPAKEKALEAVPEVKKINVSNREMPMSEENKQTLDNIKTQRGILQDMVAEHPGKALEKFVSAKEGAFEDFQDPMSAKNPSERKAIEERNRKVTAAAEIAFDGTQYGDRFDNPDVIRAAIDDFRELKVSLNETIQAQRTFLAEERKVRNFAKDEKALEKEARKNAVREMPASVDEVQPPATRGGLRSPKLELLKWKDKGWMARESLDRNVEKVAPREDAEAVNKFLGDHLRENATREVEWVNKMFTRIDSKMKELGLKKGSRESSLIQTYGENLISLSELQKESPKKWKQVSEAVSSFQKIYDESIDEWNAERKTFSYPPVPKLPNYFPHFKDISFWTKTYGFLDKNEELPTSIAGKTEFFKPGKTYTAHEQHRTGRVTTYDAIQGMEIYARSVAKQMFSMDSISRASALLNYIRQSSTVGESLGTPLHLSEFVTNLQEVLDNQLRSKTGGLDRNIEKFGRRPVIKALLTVSKLIGRNIIAFNPATALTHLVSIPLNAATVGKVPFIKGLMTTVSSPFSKENFYDIDGHRSDFLYRRYPKEHISPTKFESAQEAGGWMLKQMDIFKTRTAVASKYYELTDNGMSPEEAIKQADIYAGRIHGDYSKGQKPIILNQKMASILAQFEFGMNDAISVLLHDIPYQNKKTFTGEDGKTYTKNDYAKQVWKYAQWAVYAYLLNLVLKQVKGSGKGLDPIDMALTLAGANEEGAGQTFPARIGLAAADLAGEIPFGNLLVGNSPTASAISQPIKDAIAGNLLKSGLDIASLFLSPIGGGSQVLKTVTGLQAIKAGEASTRAQQAQALVFGPKATLPDNKVSQALSKTLKADKTKLDGFDPAIVEKVQGVFDQVEKVGFGTPEGDALVNGLSDNEYKVYKAIGNVYKTQQAIDNEAKILPIVKQVNELGFGTPAADKLVNDSFPETPQGDADYATFQSMAKTLYGVGAKGGESNEEDGNTAPPAGKASDSEKAYDQHSLINHIFVAAKALGTDPVTTFKDLFAGNSSYRIAGIENGQVIVVRAPQATTDAIKKSQGADTQAYKLDHTIPLEIGGNNGNDNLLILPTGDRSTPGTWAGNTATEDALGNALAAGKITGAQAREYVIRYKAGAGEPISKPLMDEYRNKYGGKPLTAQDIRSLVK